MPTNIGNISNWIASARNGAADDWVYNECLANDAYYAKPDSEKVFILWEAKGSSIEITTCEDIAENHPWLYSLFVLKTKNQAGGPWVRFPWNSGDSSAGMCICPANVNTEGQAQPLDGRIHTQAVVPQNNQYVTLRRWSTASRSCLGLVPKVLPAATNVEWLAERDANRSVPDRAPLRFAVNQTDWAQNAKTHNRFVEAVAPHLGDFTSTEGHKYGQDLQPSRLYSIKTGVSYVGSIFEEPFKKNLLESNCNMAITRSNVVLKVGKDNEATQAGDDTFRTQVELLTITAECMVNDVVVRDGFQVRDLSCLKAGERYLPGQALPYSGDAFSNKNGAQDALFWTQRFAIPCGRAKAKMFLKYGLIHSSANAQNFILAFDGGTDVLKGFILRDIGDTYWHDDYIQKILGNQHPANTLGLAQEPAVLGKAYHLLHETNSTSYPPPHLVRAAAYSLVTHDFDKTAKAQRGWTDAHVLSFTQGVLDGFRDYLADTLGADFSYPEEPGLNLEKATVKELGKTFRYPGEDYKQKLEAFLETYEGTLLKLAAEIRQKSAAWLAEGDLKDVDWLINAEEMALCAHLDAYLFANHNAVKQKVKKLPKLLA